MILTEKVMVNVGGRNFKQYIDLFPNIKNGDII